MGGSNSTQRKGAGGEGRNIDGYGREETRDGGDEKMKRKEKEVKMKMKKTSPKFSTVSTAILGGNTDVKNSYLRNKYLK